VLAWTVVFQSRHLVCRIYAQFDTINLDPNDVHNCIGLLLFVRVLYFKLYITLDDGTESIVRGCMAHSTQIPLIKKDCVGAELPRQ
jgi:hypothetical protein